MKKLLSASKATKPVRKKKTDNNDVAERLKEVGNIGKKTAKSPKQQKIRKQRPSVSFMGGLQDKTRFIVIWVLMVLGIGALVSRAFWLQIANADFYIAQGEKLITAKQTIPAYRGMILDRHGAVLAANAPLSTVVFSPYDYAVAYYDALKLSQTARTDVAKQNAEETLARMDLTLLAGASNVPRETLEKAVKIDKDVDVTDPKAIEALLPKGAGSKRLVLLNNVSPEIAESVTSLRFKGVFEEKKYHRYYLQPEPMAQTLGYMAQSDNKEHKGYAGRAGIEYKYQDELAGKNGKKLVLRAVKGAIEDLHEIEPAVAGKDIVLTIDSRLQYILYKELVELSKSQSADSASGMVVDVLTGDILAMASWPSFNPNNLSAMTGDNERNRALLDVFEPGSVVKPFTVATALESGKYTPTTLIDTTPGSLRLGGYSIRDSHNYGKITLGTLLQKSSNVASAKIALDLPTGAIVEMQKRFGLGEMTGLEFPSESQGTVKMPKDKDVTRRATLSYGYGQQVNLAQIAGAYATLGSGGVMHPLRLVASDTPKPTKQVISHEHAQTIVRMMRSVTEQGGTAQRASINGYHVSGKTGTSRMANPKGGYYTDRYRNIFAGIAPASNPRFVVVIMAENPKKGNYAGQTVAPFFAKVMKETLRIYNVPFDKPLDLSRD